MAILVATTFWYGRYAFLHTLAPPDYFYLAPSVMVASGQGFRNPVPEVDSPLSRFFARQTETLSFTDAVPASLGAPDTFHTATRYLLLLIGYWWRLTGISWSGLADVAAALHVLAVLGSYAALRLFLPVVLSLAGGVWLATSTLQLSFVPHVRDYSKAAFILAVLPMVVALALKTRSRWALLSTAAAAGFTIGVGIGFRMDVAIMAPIAVTAIIGFRGRRPWSDLPQKLGACVLFAVSLWIPAWPVVSQLATGGSNESHVVLLGYADAFEVGLEVDRSVYGFLPFYSDAYVGMMVSAYGAHPFSIPSPEYATTSRQMWLDLVSNFPADVYARALAAVNVVMNLVFRAPDPSFLDRPPPASAFMVSLYTWLNQFDGLGAILAVSLIAVASIVSVRHGVLATGLLLVLAGYTSLQFSGRHYFHVQFVPVLAVLVVTHITLRAAWSFINAAAKEERREALANARPILLRVAVGLTVVGLTTVLPLSVLRVYQAGHFKDLVTPVITGMRVPVTYELQPEATGGSLLRWTDPLQLKTSGKIESAYYVLEFTDEGSQAPIVAGLRYSASSAEMDLSRVLTFDAVRGINRLGFAVLTVSGQSQFLGVELGPATGRRLSGVYRVTTGGPANLLMDLLLPADWQQRPLFQRLAIEQTASLVPLRTVTCSTGPGCKGLLGAIDRVGELGPPDPGLLSSHSPIVAVTANGLRIEGTVENDSSYLAQWAPLPAEAGSVFVAEGRLGRGGGAVVGLLKNLSWYGQVFVKNPGAFVVAAPVDDAGAYTPLLTNAMSPGLRNNQLAITRAGFIIPRPTLPIIDNRP